MEKITKLSTIIFILISLINLSSCKEHQHTFDEGRIIQEASCLAEGIKEYKCTKCDETKQETINKLEHIYEITIIKATCSKKGSETKVCKLCNDTIEIELDKKDHNYIDGKCSNCDAKDPNYKEEHTHTESDWIILKEATCTKEGKKQKKCTSCDEVLSEETIKKLDHTIVIDKAVEATCKKTGLTEGSHCSVCKEVIKKQEVIEKLNHNYIDGICTICNEEVSSQENVSEGLLFELNADNKSYGVSGIGKCKDTNIVIPNIYKGLPVTSVKKDAFLYCYELENITIPNSIINIEEFAFESCKNLKSVIFEKGSKLTSIENNVFEDCTSLISIEIPSSVTNIGDSAFLRCDSLENITIPSSVTNIGDSAFLWCDSLENITIPNSIISIGDSAFKSCIRLENVIFEENSKLISIGDNAFYSCTNLTSIEIPSSVTSIGSFVFKTCENLKSVIFKKDSKLTSIGDNAFHFCTSLTSIEIPSSVTDIGGAAFLRCTSLTKIVIPNSVRDIGVFSFGNCPNLTIYCEAYEKPGRWHSWWNSDDCPVVWGYENK